MKLLVTGGAGFIGSAVIREAIGRDIQIVNIDSLTYAACLDNLKSIQNDKNYFFEKADIRDRDLIDVIFKKHIHCRCF